MLMQYGRRLFTAATFRTHTQKVFELSLLFKNTQSHEKQHKVKGFIFKTNDRRITLEMWVEIIPERQLTQVVHHKKEQRELNKKKMGLF